MPQWLIDTGFIALGATLLVLAADWLVMGASAIARRLGVSPFVVGLTVCAFGTSAPELATSVRDAIKGSGAIALGNVVGSNIANIGLILALTACVRPIPVHAQAVRKEVPTMIGVTLIGIVVMLGGTVERWEGGLLVAGIVWYTLDAYRSAKRKGSEERRLAEELAREMVPDAASESTNESPSGAPAGFWLKNLALLALGVVGLAAGADRLVHGASSLARTMGVPEVAIGLTLVAVGTSLPELATSVRAAMKGEIDLAVGNILGSNVFNILCVMGLTALVRPIAVPEEILRRDAWVMLAMAAGCMPIVLNGRRVHRLEGGILLTAYIAYCAWLYRASMG